MYPFLLIDILKLTKRNHKNIDYIYEQTEKHGQMKHLSYILTSISTPIACFKNQKITSSRYADFRRQRRALLPKQKVKASVIVTTIWNFSQSPDKKVINIVMSIAILGVFICCSNKDNNQYFNGDIRYLDNSSMTTINIESKSVPLNGDNTGMIAVYESLLICWSPNYPNHFFNIFNVDTGEEIGSFCEKGKVAKRQYPLIV